jgi:arabinofuranan 3-O-arabinosyltransferase
MAASIAAPVTGPRDAIPSALHLACFAFCVANVASIVAMYLGGTFLFDELGRAKATDFINVWAAGRLVLDGQAAAAYNWDIHEQVEFGAVGFNFGSYYGWHYPPPFLFVAAPLALLPYIPAMLAWLAISFPLYLGVVRWTVGHPFGWLFGAGFPVNFACLAVGQNGFLTAALIGGTLGFMEKRPVLSGVCLGLLTYKPQFGVLFPIVLIAARQWTVFWTAALVAIALGIGSWLAFGIESWLAFVEWLPATSQAILSEGKSDWGKLQSIFGVVRVLGGSEALAWTLQVATAVATVVFVSMLWRRPAPFELKAAALAAGTLLATPYVYLYDVVVLAIAGAFLLRLYLLTGFRRHELPALGLAAAFMFAAPYAVAPLAFAAPLIVMLLVVIRLYPGSAPHQMAGTYSA